MLKRILKKWEDLMAASAFAEAGEFETARGILHEEKSIFSKIKVFKEKVDLTVDDLVTMAITFAEAGEFKTAVEIMQEAENRLEEVKRSCQGMILAQR